MKAIFLWQPWASLMAAGYKRVSMRNWEPHGLREGLTDQLDYDCLLLRRVTDCRDGPMPQEREAEGHREIGRSRGSCAKPHCSHVGTAGARQMIRRMFARNRPSSQRFPYQEARVCVSMLATAHRWNERR